MKKRFREHHLAIFLSLLVGLIYISHHFIIPNFLDAEGEIYYPITSASFPDEALLYAPRANAAMQGRWFSGDSALAEYREGPAVLPILNPILLGGLGAMFGSMKAGIIASDFIFPTLIFLAVYFLAYEFSQRKKWSLVFASLFLFIPKLGISIPPVTFLHLKEFWKIPFPFLNSQEPFYFSQFEEPKITFFFFTIALLFFVRAMRRDSMKSAALAGISFGLLFYTYLYDWATAFAAMGLFFLWSLYKKDFHAVKRTAIIAAIGLLCSAGYWYNFWHILQYPDAIARAGGEFSHAIRFATVWKSYLRVLVLVFLLVAFWQKKDRRLIWMLGAMLFAYVIAVNVQVVTGLNPQPDHWYRVQFLPIALAAWLIALRLYDLFFAPATEKVRMLGNAAAAFFLLYFFMGTFYASGVYSITHAKDYAVSWRTVESLEWLRAHTEKGSVVGAISGSKSAEILLHTENNVFVPFGFATLASDRELWERAMILARLYGFTPDEFEAYIRASAYYLFAEEYGDHSFDANFTHYDRKLPDAVAEEKTALYRAYAKKPELKYQLDYLYVDEQGNGAGKDPVLVTSSLKKEFDKDGIRIYSFSK